MAQTKRKRRTKHRGNAAGVVEARGRTGRKPAAHERKTPQTSAERRAARFDKPPSWQSAITRAGVTALILAVVLVAILGYAIGATVAMAVAMFALYIPLGYYTDHFIYKRRLAKRGT